MYNPYMQQGLLAQAANPQWSDPMQGQNPFGFPAGRKSIWQMTGVNPSYKTSTGRGGTPSPGQTKPMVPVTPTKPEFNMVKPFSQPVRDDGAVEQGPQERLSKPSYGLVKPFVPPARDNSLFQPSTRYVPPVRDDGTVPQPGQQRPYKPFVQPAPVGITADNRSYQMVAPWWQQYGMTQAPPQAPLEAPGTVPVMKSTAGGYGGGGK